MTGTYSSPVLQFEVYAHTISDAFIYHFETTLSGLESLADEIVAFANLDESVSFPFVMMPLFGVNADHVREQANVEVVAFHPLVHHDERGDWEAYSVREQGWIGEYRGNDSIMQQNTVYYDQGFTPYIHETNQRGYQVHAEDRNVSSDSLSQYSCD
jgi:hypothetical protein